MKKMLLIASLLVVAAQGICINAAEAPYILRQRLPLMELDDNFRRVGSPEGHVNKIFASTVSFLFPKHNEEQWFLLIPKDIVLKNCLLENLVTTKNQKPKIDMPCNYDNCADKLFNFNHHKSALYNFVLVLNTAIRHAADQKVDDLQTLMDYLSDEQKIELYKIESTKVGPIFSSIVPGPGRFDYMCDFLSKMGSKIPLVKNASYNNRSRILFVAAGITGFMGLFAWLMKYKI